MPGDFEYEEQYHKAEREPTRRSRPSGWVFFFLLLSFVIGNATHYVLFGMDTATKSDVANQVQQVNDRLDKIDRRIDNVDDHLGRIDNHDATVEGELRAKKIIDGGQYP